MVNGLNIISCLLSFKFKTEWLVEMPAGVIRDGRMRQVHDHRPESATDDSTFLWKLGDRYNGISQLLLVHHTASPLVLLHEFLVAMISLM